MNICIFSRPFHPSIGGVERVAKMLAFEATRLGHSVEVVTDTGAESVGREASFPFRITRTSADAKRWRAFRRADAVLFMNVSLRGLLIGLAAGTPIVLSHHSCYEAHTPFERLLAFAKRQSTRFYRNVSVSNFVAGRIAAGSIVIPNAYERSVFVRDDRSSRERDFVFCARLVSEKGAELCIRAFALVAAQLEDATLTIMGDGPQRSTLEGLVLELGLSPRIVFTGMLDGAVQVATLQKHSCMLVPSIYEEPFGIVALEGLACCDTVIVSRRGGLPEAIGRCGLTVEPTVAELANAMTAVARARRTGSTLPGEPHPRDREAHLLEHAPAAMAQAYVRELELIARMHPRAGRRSG